MKTLILSLLLIIGFISCNKQSTPDEPVESVSAHTVFLDGNYPPYSFKENGKAGGLYPFILKALFSKLENPPQIMVMSWEKIMAGANKGSWGVAGIYKNSEREKIFDYSKPFWKERLLYFNRKTDSFKYEELNDLKGKTVALIKGWSYGEEVDQARKRGDFKVIEIVDPAGGFKMLISEEIDGIIFDEISGKKIVSTLEIEEKVKQSLKSVTVNNAYLVFPKSLNKKDFIDKLDRKLKDYQLEGKIDSLFREYILNKY